MNGETTIMQRLNNLALLALAITLAFAAPGVSGAQAQTYSDIHDFAALTLDSPLYSGILAQGRDGNLYGTTPSGGTLGFGGVFKITPTGTYSVIYNFDGSAHGQTPRSGLTLGTDGNFYGTTSQGGTSNYGNIFQITSAGTLTVLHNFSYSDGGNPYSPPIQGTDGNYYGATKAGGRRTECTACLPGSQLVVKHPTTQETTRAIAAAGRAGFRAQHRRGQALLQASDHP